MSAIVHHHAKAPARCGFVVIGRNEGARLLRCLASLEHSGGPVVYVDSGSTDRSVQAAASAGAQVVVLDPSIPFTAARARNQGWRALLEAHPSLEFVHFVDGDCEVVWDWLATAEAALSARSELAVVCGRRRERHPEKSIFNALCDIEWDTPIGPTKACGGDAMVRVSSLLAIRGFRDDLIAGEEPEMCLRLRALGWQIQRIDAEMTLHDAAIFRLSQWWKRCQRAGYAYAEGAHLHGAAPERHWVKESRSAMAWGLWLPLAIVATSLGLTAWFALGTLAYPLQVLRLALRGTYAPHLNWARALFLVLGKFPEAWGQLQFWVHRTRGTRSRLIEYKR